MIYKYKRIGNPIVEAVQYTVDNQWNGECERFIGKDNYDNSLNYPNVKTLEGILRISLGDYIIKGVKGEFYPCKPDIFDLTYEKVTTNKDRM